ncbi:MAG: nucleic acid-binding protein [Dehalococcoidia bacterium]|nr:nucleic acid-binding protein [Dehalococcoidia bacterium]|tara:strand:- start:229 stop:651 length:423 start_codon:yes stop_codon:yes gene_type:complete
MNCYKKIIPIPQGETEFYWNKTSQGQLWLRKCNECSKAYFYPRDISPCCFSRETEWVQSSGRGIVYAFSIIYRSPHEGFQDEAPFIIAIVELQEGPRMSTNIVGIENPSPDTLRIGMEVHVVFDKITDELSLPKFKLAKS